MNRSFFEEEGVPIDGATGEVLYEQSSGAGRLGSTFIFRLGPLD